MNRGLLFYNPTGREWLEYNRAVLNNSDAVLSLPGSENRPQREVYLLASYLPAITLRLTNPHLTWCIDMSASERNETKNDIGSSYFVMNGCVLGPSMHYLDDASDEKVKRFTKMFAQDVANSIRWILNTYKTTNIMQQYDLFGMNMAFAKDIRNKLAYESYTPFRLITELPSDGSTDCRRVQSLETEQLASLSGSCRITRPHLGAAPITGPCPDGENGFALNDTYVIRKDDMRRLNSMIDSNRESNINDGGFSTIFGQIYGTETRDSGRPQPPDTNSSHRPNTAVGFEPYRTTLPQTSATNFNTPYSPVTPVAGQPSAFSVQEVLSGIVNEAVHDTGTDEDMPLASASVGNLNGEDDVNEFLAAA